MAEPARTAHREMVWGDYIRRCAARDELALGSLYDESSPLVYAIAMRILQNEADASEVVGDVYKQVWTTAARFDENRGTAAAWIVTLARSRAMDRRRFSTARSRTAGKMEELDDVMSSQPGPESLAIASQSGNAVRRALADLSREQRQVLELSFFGGLSHAEISERLGQPLGTVKSRIRQAVIRLRELLKDSI
jgi:RNA polymerase sigma-70 factor (ECF subfamily)